MKPYLSVFVLCLSLTLYPLLALAQARETPPLTNWDIFMLVKSGFSPDVIITKIRNTPGRFDLAIADLQELKKANVPDAIIIAMMESWAHTKAESEPKAELLRNPGKGKFVIPAGTRVLLQLAYTVSSDDATVGDILSFTTVHPVEVGGHVIVRQGAYATGYIVKSEAGKSWARGGAIAWQMSHVNAADGTRLPLQFASTTTQGKGKGGEMAAGMVVTGLFFLPAVPLWGFKKGKGAVIPAGKRVEAIIDQDIILSEAPKIKVGDRDAYANPILLPSLIFSSTQQIIEAKSIFRN